MNPGGATLASISVSPSGISIPKGTSQQFTATGRFSDGSTQDLTATASWNSSNTTAVTVSAGGLAKGVSIGNTTITASAQGISSNAAALIVGPPVLASLVVSPGTPSVAKGLTQQFTATGTLTDGTTQDFTATVQWSSSNTTVATISATGLAATLATGNSTIQAASGAVNSSTMLTVAPAALVSLAVAPSGNPSIAKGQAEQFTATGTFTDNTTQNVTTSVTWSSSNMGVATINAQGDATGVGIGNSTIKAVSGAVNSSVNLSVSAPILTSIAVTPANPSIAKGQTRQFTATGTLSDGTTQDLTSTVTWKSGTAAAATITAAGLATGAGAGTSTISATSAAISGSTLLTVTLPVLVSIAVTPATPSLAKGLTQQFTASGTLTDGTTQNLTSTATWGTSTAAATITTGGLATAAGVGSSTISATFATITGSTVLTVTPPALASIAVTPANPSIAKGLTQQFTATGTFTDGTTQNLTSTTTWTSVTTSAAAITAAGLATGAGIGSSTIKAVSGTVTGSTTLTVTAPILVSLAVTPSNPSVAKGLTQQFTATGTLSDQTTKNFTSTVNWTSGTSAVATISSSGLASTVGTGTSNIQAASGAVNGSTKLTVSPAVLASISITPADPSILPSATVQLTATGIFTDQTTQNLTTTATWMSSNTSSATVSSAGLVTGVTFGSSTISASFGVFMGQTSVSVNSLPPGIGWHALPDNTALLNSGQCPPNFFGGDPFTFASLCQNVIRTWNGAIADTKNNRLIIWGGGHDNYYGNEIYALNLTANPITLVRVKDPTIPTNFANMANCVDAIPPGTENAPNSREGYGGLEFLPGPHRMMILNGSVACGNGDGSDNTWTISLDNLSNNSAWVHEDPTLTTFNGFKPNYSNQNSYGNIAVYDPNSGLVIISDNSALFTYNYATNTYKIITAPLGFNTSIYLSGAIDPIHKIFVAMGGCAFTDTTPPVPDCGPGFGVFAADISNAASAAITTMQDWTTATLTDQVCAEFLTGGVNPISSANPGLAYDPIAGDIVGWPNQGNSVYAMTPDPVNKQLHCTRITNSGGPPNSSHANQQPNTSFGTFGRFRYFPALGVFVLINDANIPAYILRLR